MHLDLSYLCIQKYKVDIIEASITCKHNGPFGDMAAILNSIVSNSYNGIHTNLPPEHPIIGI